LDPTGPDDQIGRLNLLTPEKVLQGIAEVREGRSFCLSLPLDLPGGNLLNNARHAPQRFATRTPDGTDRYLLRLGDVNPDFFDVVNDDRVIIHTQYSTQWDSLAHVGAEFDADGDGVAEQVFYNGWRGGEHIAPGAPCEDCGDLTGVEAKRLGIETIAETCVQGRAVMIDLHAIHGDAHVDVDFAGLAEAMVAQNVTVEAGDMVVFHTGFARKIREMGGSPDKETLHGSCAALEGHDPVLQEWVRDCGAVALISDNYAVERVPSRSGSGTRPFLPLHQLCLFKLGVPLGELWWLTDLANYLSETGRTRFLLTAPPLRLPGAVGSPVTPVATV
jgi:kynurenine formamidase